MPRHLTWFLSLLSLTTCFLAALFSKVSAQVPTGSPQTILSEELDSFIHQVLRDLGSPGGVAVAVVRSDEQGQWHTETKGYGNARLDGAPVTEDTLFSIASNSKLFTVIAAGLLIQNETLSPRITWDTKVSSIIPGWGLMDPVASGLSSISDLMSHRTGIPRHDLMYGPTDTVESILQRVQYLRPSLEFRQEAQYNNIMYLMLSLLPTNVLPSGQSFESYVTEHIFNPLGMNSTTYFIDQAVATGSLAEGLSRDGIDITNPFAPATARALPFWAPIREEGSIYSGAGGIISNIKDAAIWLQTLLLGGVNPRTNESVISPEVLLKAASGISVFRGPETINFPEESPLVYGGGQSSGSYRGHLFIEHGGDIPGYHTQMIRLPFDNLGVAVFTNDDIYGTFFKEVIKYRILDVALGLEPVDWNSRFQAASSAASTSLPAPRPSSPSLPSRNVTTMAGTYTSSGYGAIELCYATSITPATTSSCVEIVNTINTQTPGLLGELPAFVARWNKSLAEYLLLTHFDGDIFNGTAYTILPTGDSWRPFWVPPVPYPGIQAEFASQANDSDAEAFGFGLSGIWGAGPPAGDNPRDRAEAWFTRV